MGNNTLPTAKSGRPIPPDHHNSIVTALKGDQVPRDTNGKASNESGSLGSSLYSWLNAYIKKVFFNNSGVDATIEESSGGMKIEVNAQEVVTIDENWRQRYDVVTGVDFVPRNQIGITSTDNITIDETDTTMTDITSEFKIDVLGRPVEIVGFEGNLTGNPDASGSTLWDIALNRNGVDVYIFQFLTADQSQDTVLTSNFIRYIDFSPTANAQNTYKLRARYVSGVNGTLNFNGKLQMMEMF